jgi:hypothetical protein
MTAIGFLGAFGLVVAGYVLLDGLRAYFDTKDTTYHFDGMPSVDGDILGRTAMLEAFVISLTLCLLSLVALA